MKGQVQTSVRPHKSLERTEVHRGGMKGGEERRREVKRLFACPSTWPASAQRTPRPPWPAAGCNALQPKLPKEQCQQARPQPWWAGTVTAGRGETWCGQAGDVLPELGDSAGEVGGVVQGVVGEAAVGVPGVPAVLPRQVLHQHKDSGVFIHVRPPS